MVKTALWDTEDNKAPGPDDFSSKFFKDSWDVVNGDVCKAVLGFFTHGKLLRQVNATVITLVPKDRGVIWVRILAQLGVIWVQINFLKQKAKLH
uniref:Uncharacterized protein n=1 Tax=Chenopodium quinoa TaxID=63459 RepID=A0A803N4X7_CHEQI